MFCLDFEYLARQKKGIKCRIVQCPMPDLTGHRHSHAWTERGGGMVWGRTMYDIMKYCQIYAN